MIQIIKWREWKQLASASSLAISKKQEQLFITEIN